MLSEGSFVVCVGSSFGDATACADGWTALVDDLAVVAVTSCGELGMTVAS